jgi:hypothetical protein
MQERIGRMLRVIQDLKVKSGKESLTPGEIRTAMQLNSPADAKVTVDEVRDALAVAVNVRSAALFTDVEKDRKYWDGERRRNAVEDAPREDANIPSVILEYDLRRALAVADMTLYQLLVFKYVNGLGLSGPLKTDDAAAAIFKDYGIGNRDGVPFSGDYIRHIMRQARARFRRGVNALISQDAQYVTVDPQTESYSFGATVSKYLNGTSPSQVIKALNRIFTELTPETTGEFQADLARIRSGIDEAAIGYPGRERLKGLIIGTNRNLPAIRTMLAEEGIHVDPQTLKRWIESDHELEALFAGKEDDKASAAGANGGAVANAEGRSAAELKAEALPDARLADKVAVILSDKSGASAIGHITSDLVENKGFNIANVRSVVVSDDVLEGNPSAIDDLVKEANAAGVNLVINNIGIVPQGLSFRLQSRGIPILSAEELGELDARQLFERIQAAAVGASV